MNIFGSRKRDTRTSATCRTSDSLVDEAASMNETHERPVARVMAPVASPAPLAAFAGEREIESVESQTGGVEDGESDVFVCRRSSPNLGPAAALAAKAANEGVTLYVYGWENVQPGPLSWAFPSLRSAVDAVRTMRNAVEWCIVAGSEWASIDAARAGGAVMMEQSA